MTVGSEVSEPAQEKGMKLAQEMVDYLHGLDQNRTVTGGMNLMIIARPAKGTGFTRRTADGTTVASRTP